MAIVYDGIVTARNFYNGYDLNYAYYNGVRVFQKAIIYNAPDIANNPNIIRQYHYTVAISAKEVDIEIWRNISGSGIIFKDFYEINNLLLSNGSNVNVNILYGACTKNATLPDIITTGGGKQTEQSALLGAGVQQFISTSCNPDTSDIYVAFQGMSGATSNSVGIYSTNMVGKRLY